MTQYFEQPGHNRHDAEADLVLLTVIRLERPRAACHRHRLRFLPDLEKDPVNDRKVNLTGLWLETFD